MPDRSLGDLHSDEEQLSVEDLAKDRQSSCSSSGGDAGAEMVVQVLGCSASDSALVFVALQLP